MTRKRELYPEGKIGRPVPFYRRGIQTHSKSAGLIVDYIPSGLNTARDLRNATFVSGDAYYPGDIFLPLQERECVGDMGGSGYLIHRFYQSGSRYQKGTPAIMRADVQPMTVAMEWWEAPPGSGSINTEWSEREQRLVAKSYTRVISVEHLMIPTIVPSNPLGTIDFMLDKANSNSFVIDGVTYLANTLRMDSAEVHTIKSGNAVSYEVVYHYMARPGDGWVRQKRTGDTTFAELNQYEQVTYIYPPYTG